MSTLKGLSIVAEPQDVFAASLTQGTDLGAVASTGDGRTFRYVKVGSATLVAGYLVQGPAEITADQALTPIAASAGATKITIGSSVTVAANAFAGGFLIATTAAGAGYSYKISSNNAALVGTSLVLTLEDPLVVGLTASSQVDLHPSPWNGVVINPVTASSEVLGAAVSAIGNGQYGWIQTHGPCPLASQAAIAVGVGVSPSVTAGFAGTVVTAATIAGGVVLEQIGSALTGIASGDVGLVFLELD